MSSDLKKLKNLVESFIDAEAQKNLEEYRAKHTVCEACNESPCTCKAGVCEKCNEAACVCESYSYETDLAHKLNDLIDEINGSSPKPMPRKAEAVIDHLLAAIKDLSA